jgi:glycosyltransferase involved in cell wall biosynthesis
MSATAYASRPPARVLFALEQVLGHVSLAQNIKRFTTSRAGISATFADITFHRQDGLIERLPLPLYVRGALRARFEVRAALSGSMPDAFVFNTQKPAVLCQDYLSHVPAFISLDVTPLQYDRLGALYEHAGDAGGPIARLKHAANRRLFRRAARLFPWSQWVRESLIADYGVPPERIEVLPPGADTERWRPRPRDDNGTVRLLFVGGNFERKGGRLLLDWFRTAPEAARCELHLVTRDSIPAAERVHVYNDMRNNSDKLVELARGCDIFALPTVADCFSIASAEAMAVGLPVVTTSVGGIADIVEPGQQGFLIAPGDTSALAAALRPLVEDPALRRRMGAAARERAEERFDARRNVWRLLDVVEQVLNGEQAISTSTSRAVNRPSTPNI